jgi:hypothetical protein
LRRRLRGSGSSVERSAEEQEARKHSDFS